MSTNNGNKPEQQDVEQETAEERLQDSVSDGVDTNGSTEGVGEKSDVELALQKAEAKASENWDRVLRMQADMENLRRRKDQEISDVRKFSVKGFVESLLPVIDSLEMGLSVEGDLNTIREGMEMTKKQCLSALAKHKVEVENPEGLPFNPDRHQAMSMQPSKAHKNNEVMAVMQKGYVLNGRLVRPAMVVVCKN